MGSDLDRLLYVSWPLTDRLPVIPIHYLRDPNIP